MKAFRFPLILIALTGLTQAATLTGTVTGASNTSTTLPSGANTDWGYWIKSETAVPGPLNATNTSSTGTRTFSVSTFNGGSLRGPSNPSTGSPLHLISFDNGEDPVSASDLKPTGLFNSQLGSGGATAGAGLQLSVTGMATQSLINLWLFNYGAAGEVEVFLNGSETALYTTPIAFNGNGTGGKATTLLSLNFTPDSESDSLLIRYRMTSASDTTSGHVGLQTITIAPVPEPTAAALLGLGAAVFGLRRRR